MKDDLRARFEGLRPVAIIDIGSNTVRLVIFEGLTRSPTQLHNESVVCRLGSGVAQTGRMSEESVEKALAALRRFRAIISQMGIKTCFPFATAAARAAENGPDFIRQAEAIGQCKIEILTGEREAELTAKGILSGFSEPDGVAGDIGGRSLELINIANGTICRENPRPVSLELGHLLMKEQFGEDFNAAKKGVDQILAGVDWLEIGAGRPFYAIGGEWRALARLHMTSCDYPLRIFHGYRVAADDMLTFARNVVKMPVDQIPGSQELSRNRRETLRHAALVLWRVLKRLKPSYVITSAFGVREGLLYSQLSPLEKGRDPLISACEEAAYFGGRSLAYVRELCDWTDLLFDSIDHDETPQERRLRHAACLLSDVGWRAHPDYRGEQSLNLSAHWAVAGIDHPSRAFLALTNYFRHEGTFLGQPSPVFQKLLDMGGDGTRARRRARLLGRAIRAAYMIAAGAPGVISKTPLHVRDGRLILELPNHYEEFDGQRLRQRVAQVASDIGLDGAIRISEKQGGLRLTRLVSAIAERIS